MSLDYQYGDLWYIQTREKGDKRPQHQWGGYSQDFEDATHVYTHGDIQKLPSESFAICGIRDKPHMVRSLLVFDLDVHKAAENDDSAERVKIDKDVPLIQSQNGGFHVPIILLEERNSLSDGDFEVTKQISWDIDVKGSAVGGHVVAPSDIPGIESNYQIVNDAKIPAVSDPQDACALIRLDGEPLIEFDSGSGVAGTWDVGRDEDPPEDMPKCYHAGLQLRKANPSDHPNTHKVNTLTALCGLSAGYSIDDMVDHYCEEYPPGENADRSKTRYQLEHMAGKMERGDLAPPAISTLREYGILEESETCDCDIRYHGGKQSENMKAMTDGGKATDDSEDSITHKDVLERAAESYICPVERDDNGNLPNLRSLRASEKAEFVWQLAQEKNRDNIVAIEGGPLYRFEGDIWRIDKDKSWLTQLGREPLQSAFDNSTKNELENRVRSDNSKLSDNLGAPAGTIGTEAGLVDLKPAMQTGNIADIEIEPLQPDHYALHKLPVEPNPEADAPRFEEFIQESVKEGEIEKLQEYAGYVLWHHAQPFGKALFLVGPTDSGKGTFLRILKGVLGGSDAPLSAESLQQLTGRWGAAQLFGKWANVRNEVTPGDIQDIQKFKEFTGGGDRVSAEFKGQDRFEFDVTQKFIFAMNQLPDIDNADQAFWNRLLLVQFPETVPKDDQNKTLDREIIADEAAGVLNWMIEGLIRLFDQGVFTNERPISDKRELVGQYGDVFDRFMEDVVERTGDDNDYVVKSDLLALANAYADAKDMDTPWNKQGGFTRLIHGRGIDSMRTSHGFDGRTRVYRGLTIDDKAPEAFGVDVDHGQLFEGDSDGDEDGTETKQESLTQ